MDSNPFFNDYSTTSSLNYLDNSQETNFEINKIKYIAYEDLAIFNENVKLLALIRNISNIFVESSTTNWLDIFNTINDLRRVRKYYPNLFEHFFNLIINNLSERLIQSITPISRNILKLCSEIFSYHEYNEFYSDWIKKLLPKVLIKSISEINMIAKEAQEVLENLVQNAFHTESIEILLENVNSKNINISNKAFEFLMKLLYNFDPFSFINISECLNWEYILYTLLELFENKKEVYITKAFKILDYFEEIFRNGEEITNSDGYDNLKRILSQIESLEFHARWDEFIKGRAEFNSVKNRRRESFQILKTTRQTIKSDKRRSVFGNYFDNFWRDDTIHETIKPNHNNPSSYSNTTLYSKNFHNNQKFSENTHPSNYSNNTWNPSQKENFSYVDRGYFNK